jgi:molybdenum cofactor biosynthesis enzyme MoaA
MKISTFTVIVGGTACNARCPYCVSKMTPDCGVNKVTEPNWRNFDIACKFARDAGTSTALLTGKGEPTLYPNMIGLYVEELRRHGFPFIELQTNGIALITESWLENQLKLWHDMGLTTVSISIAHPDIVRNAEIFSPGKPSNFWGLADRLHKIGFSVRVSCTMVRGYVDSWDSLRFLITRCHDHEIEQLTVREVAKPYGSKDNEVAKYVSDHNVDGLSGLLKENLEATGATLLLKLPHGGMVYDWWGQNVCLGNCLTGSTDPDDIRQLIFFPDGHLRYDWRYPGAIIL